MLLIVPGSRTLDDFVLHIIIILLFHSGFKKNNAQEI